MARQVIEPIADLSNTGSFPQHWLRAVDNATSPLYELIDDNAYGSPVSNDNIYVHQNIGLGQTAVCAVQMRPADAPVPRSDGNVVVTLVYSYGWRITGTSMGGDHTDLTLELRNGYVDESTQGTVVYTRTAPDITDALVTHKIQFLLPVETDWADITARFIATPVGTFNPNDGMRVGVIFIIIGPSAETPAGAPVEQFGPQAMYRSELRITGSVNGAPVIQLINDSPDTHKLILRKLTVWGQGTSGGHTGLNRQSAYGFRRTSDFYNPGTGATVTDGVVVRLDSRDTATIYGTVRGMDFTDEQFHNIAGQTGYEYEDIDDSDGDGEFQIFSQLIVAPSASPNDHPFTVRGVGSYPWTILPGSAVEVAWLDNGTARVCHVQFEWDIVPI